jgi:hypothetical protein
VTPHQKLGCLLTQMEIKYREDKDQLVLAFDMDHYQDRDGDRMLMLSLKDFPGAQLINVEAPYLYTLPENRRDRFAEAALAVQWRVKFLRYALDEEDGEVRVVAEVPYTEDHYVTHRQMRRALLAFTGLIDKYHPYLLSVIETNRSDTRQLP